MKKLNNNKFFLFRKNILSHEKNSIPTKREGLLSIALVFPNSYAVGMSNLGFQTVYRLFNEFSGVKCERAFYYTDFPSVSKTLESNKELRDFDVVAFSISFELDFPNLVQILINAGITPLSSNRHFREPMIIAGGAVSFLNPTPLALFIDMFVIGELEPQLNTLLGSFFNLKKEKFQKAEILQSLNSKQGFYVPELFDPKKQVQKVHFFLEDQKPQYSPIISQDSHFKNMFLTEVGRGCGRRCNFCAASHIYYPFRIFPVERIMETIQIYCKETRRIGLIGSAISDYPGIDELCGQLVGEGYELGLSSFRLDKITPSFIKNLERGKVKTVTFAPEAGTERMRKLIHKNLSHRQIIEATEVIRDSIIHQIKLYFLIGLPGETWDDVEGIVNLVEEMQQVFFKAGKQKKITVSVNTFIPKPFTPFQWSTMEQSKEIRRKRKFLNTQIKNIKGVQISPKSTKDELLQGIFSLGDHNVGLAIYYKITEKLDWQKAWIKAGVDINQILFSSKKHEESMPWNFIQTGIKKENLWKIWERTNRAAKGIVEKKL